MELLKRSAGYYQKLHADMRFEINALRLQFPTTDVVKAYYSDLRFGPGEPCPALQRISKPVQTAEAHYMGVPCLPLLSDPTWYFSPDLGFQPKVTEALVESWHEKLKGFKKPIIGSL